METTIFNLIDNLKTFGAEVCYCRDRGSYHYEDETKFRFDVVLSEKDFVRTKGGKRRMKRFDGMQFFCSKIKHFCVNNVVKSEFDFKGGC